MSYSNNDVPPPFGLFRPSRSNIQYHLKVVQNPIRARCCGFGEKDRRSIDPPPIVQITATLDGQNIPLDANDSKLFTLQCDLYSEDMKESRALVYPPYSSTLVQEEQQNITPNSFVEPLPVRNLVGNVVSNAYSLYNLENEKGIYFIFSDLSVRTEGVYTLRFLFADLAAGEPMTMSTRIQAETFSTPLKVYTPKNFLGMTATTELSKCFSNQSVKIITRRHGKNP